MSNENKLTTPDQIRGFLISSGFPSNPYDDIYVDTSYAAFDPCYVDASKNTYFGEIEGVPEELKRDNPHAWICGDQGLWICREAVRLRTGHYHPVHFRRWIHKLPPQVRNKYWFHFVHTSLEDQSMVAYTPSHQYGLADRQVRMKVGRYIQKFYGEHFTSEQIRDISNLSDIEEIHWYYGSNAIYEVYNREDAPGSCMSGDEATKCYGYQYPDGQYEFGMATLETASLITARGLVALRPKEFVRMYGDDGPKLHSKLEAAGFKKVGGWQQDLRMLDIGRNRRDMLYMPYLDGHEQYVAGPHTDEAGKTYWKIGSDADGAQSYECDSPDGIVGEDDEDHRDCDCCNEYRDHMDNLMYSEYHEHWICDSCRNEYYVWAHGPYGTDYLRQSDCIRVECDDEWFYNDSDLLDKHDIVETYDGDYYYSRNTVALLSGESAPDDEIGGAVVEAGEDQWANTVYDLRSNIDGTWVGFRNKATDEMHFFHPDYIPDWTDDEDQYERQSMNHWVVNATDDVAEIIGSSERAKAWRSETLKDQPELELTGESA